MLSKHPLHSISGSPLGWRGSAIATNSFLGDAGPGLPTEGPKPRQPLSCHPFFSNPLLLTWDSSAPRESSVVLTTGRCHWPQWTESRAATNHPPGDRTAPRAKDYLVPKNKNAPKTLCTNSVVPNSVYIWKLSGFLLQMSAPGLPSGQRCQHLRGEALVLHLDAPRDSHVGPQLRASSQHQR